MEVPYTETLRISDHGSDCTFSLICFLEHNLRIVGHGHPDWARLPRGLNLHPQLCLRPPAGLFTSDLWIPHLLIALKLRPLERPIYLEWSLTLRKVLSRSHQPWNSYPEARQPRFQFQLPHLLPCNTGQVT